MQNLYHSKASIPSRVIDCRDVPLAELPAIGRVTAEPALGRLRPTPQQASTVPTAAFQSAI
jgi:hypothetical protein